MHSRRSPDFFLTNRIEAVADDDDARMNLLNRFSCSQFHRIFSSFRDILYRDSKSDSKFFLSEIVWSYERWDESFEVCFFSNAWVRFWYSRSSVVFESFVANFWEINELSWSCRICWSSFIEKRSSVCIWCRFVSFRLLAILEMISSTIMTILWSETEDETSLIIDDFEWQWFKQ